MTETPMRTPLPTCAATPCADLATTRGGYCARHVRTLALTAKLTDAIREFVRTFGISLVGENEDRTEQVIEAGEWIAQGLAMLVATQFSENLVWNPSPIRALRDRWRIDFYWGFEAFDQNDETDDLDAIELDGDYGDDDLDDFDDDGEPDEFDDDDCEQIEQKVLTR